MYNRNTELNFGQLSFRQGQTRAVGLPLDVIDKVGATMTQNYHRNRQAALKIKTDTLNLPDSGSDVNKKIIEQMTGEVKEGFAEYETEGNWWNADDAVYDMLEKITSDVRVKDLQQHYAQAMKVQEQIDGAKTSQYWKDIATAYNQKAYKGIRKVDENGNLTDEKLNYNGIGISDIDTTKYIKEINDLVTGWKADKQSSLIGGGVTSDFTTSDGYQNLVRKYGKETIEAVNPDEIEAFVSSYVFSNPMYQAELEDIARLTLFAKNGNLEPDSADVVNLMKEKATYDPTMKASLITSSPEFVEATSKMNADERVKYYNKLLENPETAEMFALSGMDSKMKSITKTFSKDKNAYKNAYVGIIREQQMGQFKGIIDKVAYTHRDIDMKYDDLSINSELYKKHNEQLDSFPVVHSSGQFDGQNAIDYLEIRDDLFSQIGSLQVEASSENTSDLRKEAIKTELSVLQSKMNAYDLSIESATNALGITYKGVLDANKKDNVQNILLGINLIPKSENFIVKEDGRFRFGKGPNTQPISKDDAEIIYEAITSNPDDNNAVKQILDENDIRLSDSQITSIKKNFNNTFKNTTKALLKDYKGSFSYPIKSLGYIGSDAKAITDLKDFHLNKFINEMGTAEILFSYNPDKNNSTNIGDKSYLFHTEKKNGVDMQVPNEISIEPVTFKNNDSATSFMPTFEITIKDPTDEKQPIKKEIIRFRDSSPIVQDMYAKLVKDAASSTLSNKNSYPTATREAAYHYSGLYAASLPANSVGGKNIEEANLNLAAALSDLSSDGRGRYLPVEYSYGGINMRINTIKNPGLSTFTSTVTRTDTGEEVFKNPDASDPVQILQYIGASMVQQNHLSRGDFKAANDISTLFKIPINNK